MEIQGPAIGSKKKIDIGYTALGAENVLTRDKYNLCASQHDPADVLWVMTHIPLKFTFACRCADDAYVYGNMDNT